MNEEVLKRLSNCGLLTVSVEEAVMELDRYGQACAGAQSVVASEPIVNKNEQCREKSKETVSNSESEKKSEKKREKKRDKKIEKKIE